MNKLDKFPKAGEQQEAISYKEKLKKYGDRLIRIAEVLGLLVFPAEASAQTFIGPDAQVGSVDNQGGRVVIGEVVIDGVPQLGKKTEGGGMTFTPEEIEALRILNDKTIPTLKSADEVEKLESEKMPKGYEGIKSLLRGLEAGDDKDKSNKVVFDRLNNLDKETQITVEQFVEALDPNSETNRREREEEEKREEGNKIYLDSININDTN